MNLLLNISFQKQLINAIAATAICFVFVIIFELFITFEDSLGKKSNSVLVKMGNKFIVDKNGFDFERKKQKLIKMGILNIFPEYIKPEVFLLTHLLASVGGIVILYMVLSIADAPIIFSFIGLLGWFVPDLVIDNLNKDDNEKMTSDVLTLLNIIATQISGGSYIGGAFEISQRFVRTKRMKIALTEFMTDINVSGDSLETAISKFESKFDSDSLQTLCTIVKQYQETGYALEVISGLKQQIIDEEEIRFENQKNKIDNAMTFVILLMFGSLSFFIIYLLLSNISLDL